MIFISVKKVGTVLGLSQYQHLYQIFQFSSDSYCPAQLSALHSSSLLIKGRMVDLAINCTSKKRLIYCIKLHIRCWTKFWLYSMQHALWSFSPVRQVKKQVENWGFLWSLTSQSKSRGMLFRSLKIFTSNTNIT